MLNLGLTPSCCIIIWAGAKWLGLANSLSPVSTSLPKALVLSLARPLLQGFIFIHISETMEQVGGKGPWTVHGGRNLVTCLWLDLSPFCHNGCSHWRL